MCNIRLTSDAFRLLLICVYMPYEGGETMTDEFADQLSVVDSIIEANADCHVIIGGDFNVDLSRPRLHTAMLNSFCSSSGLLPADLHHNADIDFTYHFNMKTFSVLDHFLLSEVLFNTAVEGVFALHDIDNTSDHEPVILQLSLQVKYVQYSERVYTPQIAWAKAKDVDRNKYRSCLSQLLCHICVPTDAIMCKSVLL